MHPKPSCFCRHRHQKSTRRPSPPYHPSPFQLSPLNPQNNIIRCRCGSGRCDSNIHVNVVFCRITPSSQRVRRCGRLQVWSHAMQLRLQYVRSHFVQITRAKALRFLRSWASTSSIKSCRRLQRWTRNSPTLSDFFDKTSCEPFCLQFFTQALHSFELKHLLSRYRNGQLLLEVAESLEQRPLKGAMCVEPVFHSRFIAHYSHCALKIAREHCVRLHPQHRFGGEALPLNHFSVLFLSSLLHRCRSGTAGGWTSACRPFLLPWSTSSYHLPTALVLISYFAMTPQPQVQGDSNAFWMLLHALRSS